MGVHCWGDGSLAWGPPCCNCHSLLHRERLFSRARQSNCRNSQNVVTQSEALCQKLACYCSDFEKLSSASACWRDFGHGFFSLQCVSVYLICTLLAKQGFCWLFCLVEKTGCCVCLPESRKVLSLTAKGSEVISVWVSVSANMGMQICIFQIVGAGNEIWPPRIREN